jgi:predicted Zn-dependent protease with MMP-like domain
MDDALFEKILKDTLQQLPPEIRKALDTVQVVVQDEPTPEQLDNSGVPQEETLYGLFEGVALPEKTYPNAQFFPDRVVIFRDPLREDFPSPQALQKEVRMTLLHELGHYFGFTEEDLKKRGYQ